MLRRAVLWILLVLPWPLAAQQVPTPRAPRLSAPDRYDDIFRKYSKRFFGVGFDWQYFKAQALAESGLEPTATSRVGARGIMQLMPGTYAAIKSRRPELGEIEDPEWNIAAGIMHSRGLWKRWQDTSDEERLRFMFGSYNAGEGTILRARRVAQEEQLDNSSWSSIETVAPKVQRWRYKETLPYVRKIEDNHRRLVQQPRKSNVAKPPKTSKAATPRPDSTSSTH